MGRPKSEKFENVGGVDTKKLAIGEIVNFDQHVVRFTETRFGTAGIVVFADASGAVTRKCFAQGGMLEFLQSHPNAKSLVLKQKLVDGEMTYNVWGEC